MTDATIVTESPEKPYFLFNAVNGYALTSGHIDANTVTNNLFIRPYIRSNFQRWSFQRHRDSDNNYIQWWTIRTPEENRYLASQAATVPPVPNVGLIQHVPSMPFTPDMLWHIEPREPNLPGNGIPEYPEVSTLVRLWNRAANALLTPIKASAYDQSIPLILDPSEGVGGHSSWFLGNVP